jgi:hypothetical protein
MNKLLPVTSILVLLGCGPKAEQPPPETPTSPPVLPEEPLEEPGAPAPENVTATYEMSVPFGPCNKMHKIYRKKGDAYTEQSQCADPPKDPGQEMELDEATFQGAVFIQRRLDESDPPYGEVEVSAIESAPEGSTKCFQTPEGAHTACQNDQGIVTYSAFDGYKLDPPKKDANRSLVLVSFTLE